MSQPPHYAPPPPPPHTQVIFQQAQQPSNGLGLAGFITSLVGLVSCGFLSPIGLLLSLFGLMKRPRGFAIAGTVLGGLGTIFLVVVGFTLVLGILGLGKAVDLIAKTVETQAAGHKAALLIAEERTRAGSLPTDAAGTALIKSHVDAWGRPLRYKRSGTTFSLISNGPDGQADNNDDITFTEAELRYDPTTMPSDGASDDADDPDADADGAAGEDAPVEGADQAPQ